MRNETIKINFIGDIVLNEHYIEMSKKNEYPFIGVDEYLSNSDFVVGNLECFAKGDKGENHLKKPRLTTNTKTLNYLTSIHLNIACLANNHAYDHLEDGFLKTKESLNNQGIQYLGAGVTEEEASKYVIIEKNNIKIAILNYVTTDTNPNLPDDANIALNFFDESKAINIIKKLKSSVDQIVLSIHWGGRLEGGIYPDFSQAEIAKKLIDAGVDLIIGHHSHTFQPYEKYKDKYIFYSLGNFCFSDFWFEGKYHNLPNRRRITGIVSVEFTKENYAFRLKFYRNQIKNFKSLNNYPINLHNYVQAILAKNKLFWNMYYLSFKTVIPVTLFLMRSDLTIKEKVIRMFNGVRKRLYPKK